MSANGAAAFSRNCKFELGVLSTNTWYKLLSNITTGYYKIYFIFDDNSSTTCIAEILNKEVIKVVTNTKVYLKSDSLASEFYFKFEDINLTPPISVVIDYFDNFVYALEPKNPTITEENGYEYCDPSIFGTTTIGEFYLKDVEFAKNLYEDFETGNLTANNFEVTNIIIGNWKFTFDAEAEKLYLSCNTAE